MSVMWAEITPDGLALSAAEEIRPGVVMVTSVFIGADVLPADAGTDRLLADLASDEARVPGDGFGSDVRDWQAAPPRTSEFSSLTDD